VEGESEELLLDEAEQDKDRADHDPKRPPGGGGEGDLPRQPPTAQGDQRPTYYARKARPPAARTLRDVGLLVEIRRVRYSFSLVGRGSGVSSPKPRWGPGSVVIDELAEYMV
jgi:hypothetical protein